MRVVGESYKEAASTSSGWSTVRSLPEGAELCVTICKQDARESGVGWPCRGALDPKARLDSLGGPRNQVLKSSLLFLLVPSTCWLHLCQGE